MSHPQPVRNPDSTRTDLVKSLKPVSIAKGGDINQKSPVASSPDDKAIPVKALHFSQLVKWRGLPGAASSFIVGKPTPGLISAANELYFDSIFLYRGEFVVDGRWFIPKTAGALLSYEF